jgi:hypothetical protein
MYVFQLFNILKQNLNADEVEIIYVIPIMMILVPFVYLIRAKIFSQMRQNDLKSFEEELLQKRSFWQQLKDLFR